MTQPGQAGQAEHVSELSQGGLQRKATLHGIPQLLRPASSANPHLDARTDGGSSGGGTDLGQPCCYLAGQHSLPNALVLPS